MADLAKTIQDPLAAKLRAQLKHDFNVVKNGKGKLGIDCVFSSEPLVYPQPDGSVCASRSTADRPQRIDCSAGFGAAIYGYRHFWFCGYVPRAEKKAGKSGASGVAGSDRRTPVANAANPLARVALR